MALPRDRHDRRIIEAAQDVADRLFVDAEAVDQSVLLGRERFAPLADAGLFGIAGPPSPSEVDRQGTDAYFWDLDPATSRRVVAAIGGGCGATFFTWVQHHGVVRTVRDSRNHEMREELLADLCDGRRMAGVAFAHLRRADRRAITATPVAGGWQFDGFAPWATSWGIADLFAVAAESEDGRVVWGIIAGEESSSVRPTPLSLPVFGATGTVALTFDRCVIPDERIAATDDVERWRADDRRRAAIGQPAVLGVAERAIRLLRATAWSEAGPAVSAADALGRRLDEAWERDGEILAELAGPSAPEATIAAASDHRARCLALAQTSTMALLAAVGGAGMNLAHPAQRLAREATFYVIQAQTVDGRAATLRRVAETSADDSTS